MTGDPSTAHRLHAQGLVDRPGRSPDDVVTHLLAVQAQDLRGARLAVRSRSQGLTAADLDAALGERRLVVAWLNRGTLHLVTAADYHWLHPLTAPQQQASSRRRLGQEGVSPEQAEHGIGLVAATLAAEGPLTRAVLRDLLDAHDVPTAGQALVHVLFAAALRGLVARGPVVGAEQAFVHVPSWLGPPPPPDPEEEVLARLAVRYLRGHPMSTDTDLATWTGTSLGVARRGLAAAGLVPDPDGRYTVPEAPPPGDVPLPTRLLGPFDPVLHGWTDRAWVLGPYGRLVTSNGIFTPVALADGRAVGTWGLPGRRARITPFEPVPAGTLDALRADADEVHRYLGLPDRPALVDPPP